MAEIKQQILISTVATLLTWSICQADSAATDKQELSNQPQNDLQLLQEGSLSPSATVPDDSLDEDSRRSIEQYLQKIKSLELSYGAYDHRLSEELFSLGLNYLTVGEQEEALQVFKRALHNTRVNNGLYNLDQIPILEMMIDTNTAMENWEDLDNNYNYLVWLYRRNYGEHDIQLLPVIDRVGRWHLKAYASAFDEEPFGHLIVADELFESAAEIIETQLSENDPALINALYGIALTNYQMAVHAGSADVYDEIRYSLRNRSYRRHVIEEEMVIQEVILRSYAKGKNAMNQIVEIYRNNPQLPVAGHALALAHLGDWYLLFNKRNSAMENYARAYQVLHENGTEQGDIDKLFGRPQTLPAIRLPVPDAGESKADQSYVLASFDVSSNGKARNIQIIESSPADNDSLRRKAKRTIAATRFRPRIENGKPVETAGVSLRYIFEE